MILNLFGFLMNFKRLVNIIIYKVWLCSYFLNINLMCIIIFFVGAEMCEDGSFTIREFVYGDFL